MGNLLIIFSTHDAKNASICINNSNTNNTQACEIEIDNMQSGVYLERVQIDKACGLNNQNC